MVIDGDSGTSASETESGRTHHHADAAVVPTLVSTSGMRIWVGHRINMRLPISARIGNCAAIVDAATIWPLPTPVDSLRTRVSQPLGQE